MSNFQILTNDRLHTLAPSIFATEPYHAMSEKYAFVPTIEVIDNLRGKGWMPVQAFESRTRTEDKKGYVKHLVRLRQTDNSLISGDIVPELVLINDHAGATAYKMLAGMFRFICSNGLIVGDTVDSISIRHTGDIIKEVGYAAKHMAKDTPKLVQFVDKMRTIELQRNEQGIFANAALELKYGRDEETGNSLAPVTAEQILMPHRYADRGCDLWTTFNVVQENLIRGGQRYRSFNHRRMKTRPVKSVDGDVRLNRALWMLASEMQRLKYKK